MFETKRLILKAINLIDANDIFEYRSRELDNLYQNFIPKSVDEVKEFIQKCSQEFNVSDTWFQLVIIMKEENKLIGDIGVHFVDNNQVEFGITLNKEYQNKGFASEAINVLKEVLFNKYDKHRIFASVDPRNKDSIKLLERLEMRKEAHFIKSLYFKQEWVDDCVYAILKDEHNKSKFI